MASYIAAMDVAVVSAAPNEGFHYSPVKLREYLACGRPVVAPRIGEVARSTVSNVSLLYEPGDADDLASQISRIREDVALAQHLRIAGRREVLENGTWDVRLQDLLQSRPYQEAAKRLGISSR
jgi:glycosyltransferase involved in cell wall biosynthesis